MIATDSLDRLYAETKAAAAEPLWLFRFDDRPVLEASGAYRTASAS